MGEGAASSVMGGGCSLINPGDYSNTLPLIPLSCFFEIRETIKFFDRPREQMHLGYSAIQEESLN